MTLFPRRNQHASGAPGLDFGTGETRNPTLLTRLRRAYRSIHRIFVRGNALHPFDKQHGVDTSGLHYPDELPTGHPHDAHSEGYYATAPSLFEGILNLWQSTLTNATAISTPPRSSHPERGRNATESKDPHLPLADTAVNPGRPIQRPVSSSVGWKSTNPPQPLSTYPRIPGAPGLDSETGESTTLAQLSDYNFVDLGCGKGRVLLLAAQHPFRSITGIELHPDLARTARSNVARWLRRTTPVCPKITVLTGDVLSAPLPDGPLVLFLFNAFAAEVMRALVQRLQTEAQYRPIDLLYLHPDQHAILRDTPGIQLLADADIPFSAEDARADAFNVTTDRCTICQIFTPPHTS